MPRLKKKKTPKQIKKIKNRKKHVETMFLTQNQKKYPYFYKPNFKVNPAQNNYSLKPGLYYIRCLNTTYVEISVFKSVARIIKWYIKKFDLEEQLYFKFLSFPDFVLTSKPKDVRMGKGKGPESRKVGFIKKGQLFLMFKLRKSQKNYFLFKALIRQISFRLSFPSIFTHKNW